MTFSPSGTGRPLFVPPGISVVRTGPTTPAEFQRLLEDDVEHSGIRPSSRLRLGSTGLLGFVAEVLGLCSSKRRSPPVFHRR